ncbi:hypothetical protein MBLNU230_g7839t1 [Neophaeotheca triangularis]
MSGKNWATAAQKFREENPGTNPAAPRTRQIPVKPEKAPNAPFELPPLAAFYIFFAVHTLSALTSPINDCDEVFNYWEPTHYLTHGHAFQTWEYSPEYALRSWSYATLHAVVVQMARLIPFITHKSTYFYIVRIVLGFMCACCETRLFSKINGMLNPRVAIFWTAIMAMSPGMWQASVSYLPSSFGMYMVMLGVAAFMDWRGGLRTNQGLNAFGTGALLGWPFVAALGIPFVAEELLLGVLSDIDGQIEMLWRFLDGIVRGLLTLVWVVPLDVFYYRKLVFAPWNMIAYNIPILSGTTTASPGPEIFGTEPWTFYFKNLTLNFHVWLPLALLSLPLLLLQHFTTIKGSTKQTYLRGLTFLTPFYLWLTIMTLQPHKEERFLYPAYPCLALNAAISLHIILANLGSRDPRDFAAKIPLQLRFLAIISFITLSIILSVSRITGTTTAYAAPLFIYKPLHTHPYLPPRGTDATLCLGKEWHRFPSHYHLPPNIHAKFIKSEFSGLLPGEFSTAKQGFGVFPGTWLIPPGMNNENREDVGKYTDVRFCDFLVDSKLPSTVATALEPDFVDDEATWERVLCLPFLDAASTGVLGRLGWVPEWAEGWFPLSARRVWGRYCLLRRRSKVA